MSFLSPAQFCWLLAAIVLVLFYLRWARHIRMETATLPLWEQAFAKRTWWSRFRRWASLLLLLALLAVMTLALANPYFPHRARAGRNMVLIIDTSASMNAVTGKETPLAQACRAAQAVIADLGRYDRVAIFSAGSGVKLECPMTGNQHELFAAVGSIRPTDGVGGLARAIEAAQDAVAGKINASITVFSDYVLDHGQTQSSVTWQLVGAATNNYGITQLAIRDAPLASNGEQEVFIEVANFSDAKANFTVEVTLPQAIDSAAAEIEQLSFELLPNSLQQRTVVVSVGRAGLFTAKLTAQDSFPADNLAELLVSPPLTALNVRLITTQVNSPTAAALGSLGRVRLQVEPMLSSPVSPGTILVFEEDVPQNLPEGPLLVLGPKSKTNLWSIGRVLTLPVAVASHGIDLRHVNINEAAELIFANDYPLEVFASTETGEPLAVGIARPVGPVFVLGFSPSQSDWPQRSDFPAALLQGLAWLASPRREIGLPARTDEAWVVEASDTARTLTSPFGVSRPLPKGRSVATVLEEQGVWEVSDDDASKKNRLAMPASILNATESDLRFAPDKTKSQVPRRAVAEGSPLWTWLVATAIIVCLVDWILFHRGITE